MATNYTKLAATYKALGNPARLKIIELLLDGELNVTAINKAVPVSQPSLSQHLSKLRGLGVVKARRDERFFYYRLTNPQWTTLRDVVESF